MTGGGSDQSLKLLYNTLSKKGHNVDIITVNSDKNNCDSVEPIEYQVPRNRIKEIKRTKNILQKHESYDLYHIFNPGLLVGAGLYKSIGDNPVVGRLNTYNLFCTNISKMDDSCHRDCKTIDKISHDDVKDIKKFVKFPEYLSRTHIIPHIVNNVDLLFAQSPSVKKIYKANGYSNIITIPNFCDPNFPPNRKSSDVRNTNNQPTKFLYVGRLEKQKGIDTLLSAFEQAGTKSKLTIVGDGRMKAKVKSYADSRSNVSYHGWIDHADLFSYYNQSDVFVHPGEWPDPCPRTILESLQCQTPCLVSNVGAPPWMAGDAGTTYRPGDPVDLAETITALSKNDYRLNQLESNTEARVDFFSKDNILPQVIENYNRCV
ncbi:Glycosyltransferase [Natranaeroarchaeum sulfidigenes]|uniref:Glycosyltransferase n=2 Tax=Natranaeroarchaeum sulfidigenes TaxID=2784880 RepID=A0A897MU32_9EURY|nr:Glycosyltransferase [Natranaeroarchaeum sulfidigenes]